MVKTHEQIVADRHTYYITHLEACRTLSKNFAINNPNKVKIYQDRFAKKHPFYRRDKKRIRVAVTDNLIFEFLDNCLGRDIKDYISYLHGKGIPGQHIKWFQVDIKPHLRGSSS